MLFLYDRPKIFPRSLALNHIVNKIHMNTAVSYVSEALVGPPSKHISIREFIEACIRSPGYHPRRVNTPPPPRDCDRPEPEKRAIEKACR